MGKIAKVHVPGFVLAVCALVTIDSASAQQKTVVHHATEDVLSFSGAEYWTREMRANSEPYIWNEEPIPPTDFDEEEELGPEISAPSRLPRPRANQRAKHAFPDEWEFDDSPQDFSAPENGEEGQPQGAELDDYSLAGRGVFDAYRLNNSFFERQYPWKAIGKLFFNQGSTCSASVISGNNIIVTAAHCCYDRTARAFNANFAFVPGTRNNSAPFGVFPYQTARVLSGWINVGGRQNDVCVIRLRPNQAGQTVSSLTGSLGRSLNLTSIQHHHPFGYPGNLDQALIVQVCSSESFSDSACGGSAVLNTGCNQTFGASGGPWIRVYKPLEAGSVNFVNSVVSGRDSCTGPVGLVFNGPRFTSNNIGALCTAEGC